MIALILALLCFLLTLRIAWSDLPPDKK